MDTYKLIGLDIGRCSAVACSMAETPADLVEYIRRYKPSAVQANQTGIEEIAQLGELFALEPTGKDHRWWVQELEKRGKQVLLICGMRIRNHAKGQGITNKGDKEDAAVIAHYARVNLEQGNSRAFQSGTGNEIADLRRELVNAQRHRTKLTNQLKARLSVELPEQAQFRPTRREWGEASPACWEKLNNQPLSWKAKEDIQQIIYWHNREARIEAECDSLLGQAEFDPYRPTWEHWQLGQRQTIAILGAIHPIDQYLDQDGRRVIEHLYTKEGKRVKCDRTLRGIHRALGYGRIKYQSGSTWKWGRSGDGSTVAALYMWLESNVVIRRTPNRRRLAKLYELPPDFEKQTTKKQKAWIEAHNFRNFCLEVEPRCNDVRPLPRDKQRVGYLPWKDQHLIDQIKNYSGCPARIAQLQLYYEWGYFEIGKHERILKCLPMMIRLLVQDLIE